MGAVSFSQSDAIASLRAELHSEFSGVLEAGYSLAEMTTYGIGGNAALFAEPSSERDLVLLKAALAGTGIPKTVLGRGSNVLISDSGFDGVVIRLGSGFRWSRQMPFGAASGGASPLPSFSRWCSERGLAGIEFGVGIPASVGGAVRMNAGGHGREIKDVLRSVRVVDLEGEDRVLDAGDLEFGYRTSSLPATAIVVEASFDLVAGDPSVLRSELASITRWRRENQPGGAGNAGSIFKNPRGDSAGRLIDAAELKGLRVGGAEVSQKHANFFIAGEGATASDIAALIGAVRKSVYEKFGVELKPEIRLVGEFAAWPPVGGDE